MSNLNLSCLDASDDQGVGRIMYLAFGLFFAFCFLAAHMGKTSIVLHRTTNIKCWSPPGCRLLPWLRQSDHFTGCFIWAQLTTVISGGNPITKPCWLAFVNSKCAVILSRRWYFTVEFFDPSWFFNCTFFYFWKGFTGRNLHRKFIFLAIFKGSFVNLLSQ